MLQNKAETRCSDEATKALACYRQFELTQMYANFYGNDAYHQSRKNFVYKISDNKTPENIALHRQKESLSSNPAPGSMSHFVWQQQYEMDDVLMDSQHKDLFVLAEKLHTSSTKKESLLNIKLIYLHVKEHFREEEALMKKLNYRGYQSHEKEHTNMLKKLIQMDHKINDDTWEKIEVQDFVDDWGKHIIHSDMPVNDYIKQQQG